MDAAIAGVIATAAVGIAGIAAAFFAPTWTQTKAAERSEARELRRAKRLVSNELDHASGLLKIVQAGLDDPDDPRKIKLEATTIEWDSYRAVLAAGLPESEWDEVALAYKVLWGALYVFTRGDSTHESLDALRNIATRARETTGAAALLLRPEES
jgi:hypothetical protein